MDDFRAEPLLREDGGALLVVGGSPLGLGHGDLGELLLQRVRDDLVALDRVDCDLDARIKKRVVGLWSVVGGGGLGMVGAVARTAEEGVQGLRRRRRGGVVGGGCLGKAGAVAVTGASSVEEVVEAPADDVGVQILVPQNHGGSYDRSIATCASGTIQEKRNRIES